MDPMSLDASLERPLFSFEPAPPVPAAPPLQLALPLEWPLGQGFFLKKIYLV